MILWHWVIRNSRSLVWGAVLYGCYGFYAFLQVPVTYLPEIPIREMVLVFTHDVQEPERMENDARSIIQRLEGLRNLVGKEYRITSAKLEITLSFEAFEDHSELIPEIRARIDGIGKSLQYAYKPPVIMAKNSNRGYMFKIMIHGNLPFTRVTEITRNFILPQIKQINGIAYVDVNGLLETGEVIWVRSGRVKNWTSSDKLSASITESPSRPLSSIVKAGNQQFPLVYEPIRQKRNDWLRRKVPVSNGHQITLGDIAFVGNEFIHSQGIQFFDNQRAVAIKVFTEDDTEIPMVREDLLEVLKNIQKDREGLTFNMIVDHSQEISTSLNGLWYSLLLGIVVVVLSLFLFSSDLRIPLVIALQLPFSILFALGVMHIFGMTLNIISLSGLIFSSGILIDNAIVVMDGITRYHQRGFSRIDACYKGLCEMTPPLLGSNLTTLAIFVPLFIDNSLISLLFQEEARVIFIAILCSIFLAFILLPLVYIQVFRTKIPGTETKMFVSGRDGIVRMTSKVNMRPIAPILMYGLFLLFVVCYFDRLPMRMAPDYHAREWKLPAKADIKEKLDSMAGMNTHFHWEYSPVSSGFLFHNDADSSLLTLYGLTDIFNYVDPPIWIHGVRPGDDPISSLFNLSAPEVTIDYAGEVTAVENFETEVIHTNNLNQKVQSKFAPVRFQLLGPVHDGNVGKPGGPEVRFSHWDSTIYRTQKRSVFATNVLHNHSLYTRNQIIGTTKGRITRVAYSSREYAAHGKIHEHEARLRGLIKTEGGQLKANRKHARTLRRLVCLSMITLYLVLLIQYGSLWWPLLVMFVLPAGVGGSLLTLYLSGHSLNIMSGIGLLAMMGIVVNDAILKVSAIRMFMYSNSMDLTLQKSIRLRLKPILMTTITTILSCLPILFLDGTGNDLQRPLAWTIIGGVTASTIATLFLIPALAKLLGKLKVYEYGNLPVIHHRR